MNRRWLTLAGAAVTVVSLVLAFRGSDPHAILSTLAETGVWWAIPVLGATMLSIWIRAWRWRLMLDPLGDVSTGETYRATMIGFMANNVLPMRLGELVRAYSIGRASGVSKSAAFATIVVERAFDLLAILLLLGIVLLRFSTHFPAWVLVAGYVAVAACAGLFLVMGLLRWKRELTVRFFTRAIQRLPHRLRQRTLGLLHRFLDGLEVLSRAHRVLGVTLLSLATWLAVALSFLFTAYAFDLPRTWEVSLLLVVLTALAVMLPSGPGFVGTFEMGVRYGLALVKVDESRALSVAIFYHTVQFIPITLLGLYHLWRQNFSLRRAVEEESRAVG
jgi:glycosyltransferase 2 family protein